MLAPLERWLQPSRGEMHHLETSSRDKLPRCDILLQTSCGQALLGEDELIERNLCWIERKVGARVGELSTGCPREVRHWASSRRVVTRTAMFSLLQPHARAEQLRRLVSPVFFRLFPPGVVSRQIARLLASPLRRSEVRQGATALNEELFVLPSRVRLDLSRSRCGRRITGDAKAPHQDADRMGRSKVEVEWVDERGRATCATGRHLGDEVLRIYFAQLLVTSTTFVDLSFEAFDETEAGIIWTPSAVHYRWSSDFRAAFLDICRGYYRCEGARFDAGLEELGLEAERSLMLEHFGGAGDCARFSLHDFLDTFGRVFDSCAARGARLHPDFLVLGVCLGTLYQHLERYPRGFDRRAAYESAVDAGE